MDVAAFRARAKLTQAELAQLIGLHPLTISKIERGVSEPQPFQRALLRSFQKQRSSKLWRDVRFALTERGTAAALALALHHEWTDP